MEKMLNFPSLRGRKQIRSVGVPIHIVGLGSVS